MKVKIVQRGGYADRFGKFHVEGAVVDFPEELAKKLIDRRIALSLKDAPAPPVVIMTNAFEPAENAMVKRGPGRLRKA